MIDTCKLHDDLEGFASYLGVDYEDYYQLIYSLPDEDESIIQVELTVWFYRNVFALKLHMEGRLKWFLTTLTIRSRDMMLG